MADIEALKASLGDIPMVTDRTRIQLKSRNFCWYSPILKRQLENVRADLVVDRWRHWPSARIGMRHGAKRR